MPDPAPFVRLRSPAGENKQKDKKQELSKTFDAVQWCLWCGTEGTAFCAFPGQARGCQPGPVASARRGSHQGLKDQMCLAAAGILDGSFRVSVFLWSPSWARRCLWSCSLARTRCYVGFYGGKKNRGVARPGRVLKKEKKEGEQDGVEEKCDPRVLWRWNLDFTPLPQY